MLCLLRRIKSSFVLVGLSPRFTTMHTSAWLTAKKLRRTRTLHDRSTTGAVMGQIDVVFALNKCGWHCGNPMCQLPLNSWAPGHSPHVPHVCRVDHYMWHHSMLPATATITFERSDGLITPDISIPLFQRLQPFSSKCMSHINPGQVHILLRTTSDLRRIFVTSTRSMLTTDPNPNN